MGISNHGFLPKDLLILDRVWQLYLAYSESLSYEIKKKKKVIKAFSDHMGLEWQKLRRRGFYEFTENVHWASDLHEMLGYYTKLFLVLWHLLSKNPLEGRFCIYSQACIPLKTFLKTFRAGRCKRLGSSVGKRWIFGNLLGLSKRDPPASYSKSQEGHDPGTELNQV